MRYVTQWLSTNAGGRRVHVPSVLAGFGAYVHLSPKVREKRVIHYIPALQLSGCIINVTR